MTAIRPDDLEASGGVGAIAGTATDLNWDTYILSGAAMMKDGECVRSGYPLDLDTLTVGSRVGKLSYSCWKIGLIIWFKLHYKRRYGRSFLELHLPQ